MATPVNSSPIKKVYGETVSLTTTAKHILFRPDYHEVLLYCPTAFRMGLAPRLARVKYYDASATTYTDYTAQATDRDDTTHVPLDAMATGDYLYLGFTNPVRGFYVNMGSNVNSNAATLDVEYCSAISAGSGTFTDVAGDSDGTTSGGATLAQDGLYSFTLPAVTRGAITALDSAPLYWYRFAPSAALSATVDLVDIVPACDTTNYGYMEAGINYQFSLNTVRCGAFEFDHASSDTLNITWIQH